MSEGTSPELERHGIHYPRMEAVDTDNDRSTMGRTFTAWAWLCTYCGWQSGGFHLCGGAVSPEAEQQANEQASAAIYHAERCTSHLL